MIRYKIDVLAELKNMGYNQTRLQSEALLARSTLTKLKAGDASLSLATLNILCIMLKCQPGDIIECVPLPEEIIKFY